MIRLQAKSVAASASMALLTGTVHSVHGQGCNLAVSGQIHAAVVTPAVANVVKSLVVAVPSGFTFRHCVAVGMPASHRHGILRIGSGLTVDTRHATIWNDSVHEIKVDLAQEAQHHAWCEAWTTLGLGGAYPLGNLSLALNLKGIELEPWPPSRFSARANSIPLAEFLPGSWHCCDDNILPRLRRQVGNLIGAGPGLTPAGDDLLVGYLAGLISGAGVCVERLAFIDAVCAMVRERIYRTNLISRFFLQSAIEGRVAERLRNLLEQISAGGTRQQTREAAMAALAVGSSSGPAGVLGLLLGLAAWQLPSRDNDLDEALTLAL